MDNESSIEIFEILSAIPSPKAIGIVFNKESLSACISRISNGMAMAKIKVNRSANSSKICKWSKDCSSKKTGTNTVAPVHTKDSSNVFIPVISSTRKLCFCFPGNGNEYRNESTASGIKRYRISVLTKNEITTNPAKDEIMSVLTIEGCSVAHLYLSLSIV